VVHGGRAVFVGIVSFLASLPAAASGGTADHGGDEWWRVPAMIAAALVLTVGLVMRVRAGRDLTRRRD
jgi:hypothetical protein